MYDKILVLDTETASLTQGVCEVAFYLIDSNFNILSKHRSLIDPECDISPIASGVHGLVYDDVKDAPTLDEYFQGAFKDKSVLMIGHNIKFDIRFVGEQFKKITPVCTLKLARLFFKDAPDHKLQTLMFYLGLTKGNNHSALDDVNTSYEMLLKISKDNNLTLDDLIRLSNTPVMVDKIGFGKHKGTKVKDLPSSYIKWLMEQDNLDENLKWTIEQLFYKT